MRNRNHLRLCGAMMILVLLMSLAAPAFAASSAYVSPNEVRDRVDDEFDLLSDKLLDFLYAVYDEDFDSYSDDSDSDDENDGSEDTDDSDGSDDSDDDYDSDEYGTILSIYNWFEMLSSVYADSDDNISAFIEVEDVRDSTETDPETGSVYYTKALSHSFIFGASVTDEDAVAEMKGVYNRADGRYTVDTKSDLYFDDGKVRSIYAFDYVGSTKYLFMQFAYYDDYDYDLEAHVYDVFRVMIGNGTVRCAIGSMTESQLNAKRIKSPYSSWEAFRFSEDCDQFVFDGKSITIIENGVKTVVQ